jgi:hypothetical protein
VDQHLVFAAADADIAAHAAAENFDVVVVEAGDEVRSMLPARRMKVLSKRMLTLPIRPPSIWAWSPLSNVP